MSDDGFAIPAAPKRKSQEPAQPQSPPSPQQQDAPPLPYKKPEWSALAQHGYGFEVLKGGLSLDKIHGPQKEFATIGRLPLCDIQMEHPSISRYHAVIQFNHDGNAFIYDLDSAHGTRVNKQRIAPRTHIPLQPGDQVRFGESTRICIFDTDQQLDEEEEIEKEEAIRHRSRAAMTQHAAEERNIAAEEEGISWGFQEDAVEEPDEDDEEEEGEQNQEGPRSGDADLIDVVKEKMMSEDAKRRRDELDIMYGDESDEEALYDKTAPKKKKAKTTNKAETYQDLVNRKKESDKEITALEADLKLRKKEVEDGKSKEKADDEDLDAYMKSLSKKSENKPSVYKLESDLKKLRKVQ
ncbi:SMAD/FHA domain-containing protein [Zychaea mexicana]|uniref:SMAD/FHA domain-containing protein n=1 Tax=Zychaea mexicana TaxID=64656 RepID=UPI0022FE2D85|nr:SMAD/FHA domain-containing protein [Zychaea mexicana]KAI9479616.1 SMAD/FHA domain-containing protein [Zychaea mexicana]